MKIHVLGIGMIVLVVGLLLCAGCTQPATPPATATPTPTPTSTPVPVQKDIVQTAVADGRFTTLVAAVQAADLATTLSGPVCLRSLRLRMMPSRNYLQVLLRRF